MIRSKFIIAVLISLGSFNGWSQEEWVIESEAERPISPSYRITEQPKVIDTVIPTPTVEYPLLVKSKETVMDLEDLQASRIRIKDKLDKLYPGYLKLGLGNYTSPLGEFYFNSTRDRRMNYGVHLKHFSSWRDLEGLGPSAFDRSSGKIFGEFFTSDFKIESELSYLNNGYHFYGITDTTDFLQGDTLANRVQHLGGFFKIGNFESKDSAKLLWTAKIGNYYTNEFQRPWDNIGDKHARNNNFFVGANFQYKKGKNLYDLDFNWLYNRYQFGEDDPSLPISERQDDRNALVNLRPTISTYGDKWKVVYGLDINFDFPKKDKIFKVVPVVEAKYSLFNDMFIPYVGINGGVTQNTFFTLNRMNPYMYSGQELLNETLYNFYGGIKGTLSKTISFNVAVHYRDYTNKALFVNEQAYSDLNRFDVVYDNISAFGGSGSISYQKNEKLKIDVMAEYNRYTTENEIYAWHLPELKLTARGSYNLYDKLYAKLDFTLESGRKSPVYLFNQADDDIPVDLGLIADGNIEFEYRYNSRISAFLQFNNVAAQKYDRWYNYRVQGFQVLGGVTFGF